MSVPRQAGQLLLDLLSHLPYWRGKGFLALAILRLCNGGEALPLRLPGGGRALIGARGIHSALLPYWLGKYEREVTAVFRECLERLQPGQAVIDVGANLGFYTVIAGEYLRNKGQGRVVAFEPSPTAFACLENNIRINRFENVDAVPQGVADAAGTLPFYSSPAGITLGSLRSIQSSLTTTMNVAITTLDDYIGAIGNQPVGLIMIDVEGGELLVLRGAKRILTQDRPLLIYEEYPAANRAFGYSFKEIRSFLKSFGYQLSVITSHGLVSITSSEEQIVTVGDYQNIIAVPGGKPGASYSP